METIHYNQSTNPVNHVVMGYGHSLLTTILIGQQCLDQESGCIKISVYPKWSQFVHTTLQWDVSHKPQ